MINDFNFRVLGKKYKSNNPFPHIVIDNFLDQKMCKEIEQSFPNHNEDFWLKYNNPVEKKLLYNHLDDAMPNNIKKLLLSLNEPWFLENLNILTGIENLVSDPNFHGGGMHCTKRHGKLDVHIDYSLHPQMNYERRINLILYLNSDWVSAYGGNLEFWNSNVSSCEKSIEPVFNRAVIFNTSDISFHGHPDPLNCPDHICRKSLAWYYLTKPQKDVTKRYRARFVPRPNDPKDKNIEEFRKQRSQVSDKELFETEQNN